MNCAILSKSNVCFSATLFALSLCFTPNVNAQQSLNVPRLWAQSCISCHADDASKDLRDLTGIAVGDIDKAFFDAINHGIEDLAMPAFGDALSQEEIWALTVHIRELQHAAARRRGMGTEIKPANQSDIWTTSRHSFTVEQVLRPNSVEIPWGVEPLPGGGALITDRSGALHVLTSDGTLGPPVRDTPRVRAFGQGGMMDVALDPDYTNNNLVYIAYADPGVSMGRDRRGRERIATMTRVDRGRIESNTWVPVNTVYKAPNETYLPTGLHFGTRLVFDDDGHVFIPIGDRGVMEHAQDLSRPNGKIHRVRTDGTVPQDNPFINHEGALDTIYSLGHRNPQGLVMDTRGRLWDTEHGPRGGDELNLITRAHNYGWPVVSFGINYSGMPFVTPWSDELDVSETDHLHGVGSVNNIEMPKHVWIPSIAACGMAVVTGSTFPAWEGDLLVGGLAMQTVRRVRVDAHGTVLEDEEIFWGEGRVRDVQVGPDGAVWIALERPGRVVRLVPTP